MRIAITGACGLLGRAASFQAQSQGHAVVALDASAKVHDLGAVEAHQVDVRDLAAVTEAIVGIDAVIHTASLIDLHLGRPERLKEVNVDGAQNVVNACRASGIQALVHMSSAEVISGLEPLRGVTEAQHYPAQHLTYYGETKQLGEEVVLAAADAELGTCAMRTFGLFGEGDNTLVPMYLSRLVRNRVAHIGEGSGRTDTVYAPNLAHALVLAAEQLAPSSSWSGTAFHVTDNEPVNIQQFLREVTEPLDVQFMSNVHVPRSLVNAAARLYELRYRARSTERFAYPRLTTHSMKLALDDYWLDGSKIRRMLGYEPIVDRSEAVARTQAWVRETYG